MSRPHPEKRAADPNTPLDELAALAENYPAEVANNPALLLEIVTGNEFLRTLTSDAIIALITCPSTPEPLLLHIISEIPRFSYMRHEYTAQALIHPNLPPEGFTIIQSHIKNQYIEVDPDLTQRHQHNPNKWQGDATALLRERLQNHRFFFPHTPILDYITALPTWAVEAIQQNPHLKKQASAWKNARAQDRHEAQPLPSLPTLQMECALLALELDPHPDPRITAQAHAITLPLIRLALAHNPTSDHQTLQRLTQDPDLAVSQAAQRTLNHPSRAVG